MGKGGIKMHEPTNNFELFSEGNLSDKFLSVKTEDLKNKIEKLPEEKILEADEERVVEVYYKEYYVQPLEIDAENVKKDLSRKMINESDFPESARLSRDLRPGKSYSVKVAVYCLPFTGNSGLFYYAPSKRLMCPFNAHIKKSFVCFEIEVFSGDAKTVKNEFSSMVNNLKKQIEYINNEVAQYNNALKDNIKDILKSRKDRIIEDKKFLEEL